MENRDEKRNYYVTIEEYQSNPKYYEKEAASVRKILHVTRTPEQSEEILRVKNAMDIKFTVYGILLTTMVWL
jgi:hypothetical protein